jgi:predicted ATPase
MSVKRIAVTGGPGAGKTTLLNALCKAHGRRVHPVPEVATHLLHVFPPIHGEIERRALQQSIFHVQRNLEVAHEAQLGDGQVLLCDRGTPDGGGYWPEGHEALFALMQTTWQAELSRYDAVLFLETAAAQGFSIIAGNPTRLEDRQAAIEIDRRLHAVWSKHPRFCYVPCQEELAEKIALGMTEAAALIGRA